MPEDLDSTLIELQREFLSEQIDYAVAYARWTQRHLEEGRDERAIAAFEIYLAKTREAAAHMKIIRTAVLGDPVAKAAIVEFRAERNRRR